MWKIVRLILWLFRYHYTSGMITAVASGTKVMTIVTEFTPNCVYLSFSEPDGFSGPDYIDYRIVPSGFVIVVDLSSATRTIMWVASGKAKHG